MRVTHIITRLIVGGAQENTVASVLGLRNKPGLEVDLISGPTSGSEGSLESSFKGLPGALTVTPNLIRPVHLLKDCLALRDLIWMIRERKPDIVHTHSSKAGVLGRLAARRAGVRVIVHTIHGPSFGPFQGKPANAVFMTAERLAALCTTHFVVVASAMKDQFLAARIGRAAQFTRIFSGFTLEPFLAAGNDPAVRKRLGFAPDDFVVGKVARLFKLKGHEDLILAAPELVRRCARVKFLIVGGGPQRERLETAVRTLGLEKHFVFTGLVPPEEIPGYLGVMDVLVHLSYREGIARALPQALAAGRPVIAYDCDGAREVCLDNDTGFLVPPGDRQMLIERLLRLVRDAPLRERLRRRGPELVKEWFPVERMVNELHALYLRLTKTHAPSATQRTP